VERVTFDETQRRVAELVEVACGNPERSREMVDQLLLDVLRAIGDGTADKPADQAALAACACDYPLVQGTGSFGTCMLCGRYAAGQPSKRTLEQRRALAAVPAGHRDPDLWKRITKAHREEHEEQVSQLS
jgi:hypothetical protein